MNIMSPILMVTLLLGSIAVMILPGNAVPEPALARPDSLGDNCARLFESCTGVIYSALLRNGSVNNKCCTILKFSGKRCLAYMSLILCLQTYCGINYMAETDRVWESCVSTPTFSPSL